LLLAEVLSAIGSEVLLEALRLLLLVLTAATSTALRIVVIIELRPTNNPASSLVPPATTGPSATAELLVLLILVLQLLLTGRLLLYGTQDDWCGGDDGDRGLAVATLVGGSALELKSSGLGVVCKGFKIIILWMWILQRN
jgi:hypothetical protein